MAVYLAFCDLLGFKEFIDKNSNDYIARRFEQLMIHTGLAVSSNKIKTSARGNKIPDIDKASVHCMLISDSIIFWTNSDTPVDFENILGVVYRINNSQNIHGFPLRGALVHGEIEFNPYVEQNKEGISWRTYSLFGKALVAAYKKAEAQKWAGCVVDYSAVNKYCEDKKDIDFLSKYCFKYNVPYENDKVLEYAVRLVDAPTISNEAFETLRQHVIERFNADNKSVESEPVKLKMNHTIEFLQSIIG